MVVAGSSIENSAFHEKLTALVLNVLFPTLLPNVVSFACQSSRKGGFLKFLKKNYRKHALQLMINH